MKTGLGQDAWNAWGLKPLSKQCGSGFAEIRSGNRRTCPESWTFQSIQFVSHQGRSTYDSAPPLKGAPPYSCFEGVPTDKSTASLPMARRERARKILLTEEKIFIIQEQYNNQNNKIYAQTSLEVRFEGARRPLTFLGQGLLGGVPSRGDTPSFLQQRVRPLSECIKRTCHKKLWNILTL